VRDVRITHLKGLTERFVGSINSESAGLKVDFDMELLVIATGLCRLLDLSDTRSTRYAFDGFSLARANCALSSCGGA
jgi:hypothetical protein